MTKPWLGFQTGFLVLAVLYAVQRRYAAQDANSVVAEEFDKTLAFIKNNLAHGYLLTNQFAKAKAIYLENQDLPVGDGRSFKQAVLDDFKELRAKGITHPDMDKIERRLQPMWKRY